ncbi:hypothetical protein NDI49_18585 [Trichocoleus sp. ST-U3]|uniref:hypothetical protein n=1 Tax=Coleofasciculus sp. FACHB-542 TaxID=2692787 RepID=UPI0016835467|nr:hypothetical protein [Coleofasciculus sp. FACHB-542]MBD2085124.1 hypothetical protein [Coleofasciculus sp. FACHB-542]
MAIKKPLQRVDLRKPYLKLTQARFEYLQQLRQTTHAKIAQMFVNLSEDRLLRVIQKQAIINNVFEGKASEPPS